MRKILIALLLVIVAVSILWIWRGRDLSMLADRFHLIETGSHAVKTIAYEGNGSGGTLRVDDIAFSLNEVELGGAQPSIGTTKDDQLALSFGGKVFPFGPVTAGDILSASVSSDDVALVVLQHSAIGWPNFFEVNFMTGNSPRWKRNIYQTIRWKKPNGENLEMVWRYEQFYYAQDHWVNALMTRPGSSGLIRVKISDGSR